ncbi:MAG: putative zinc-binding protein [Burkholderiales bacterium]|nr:putative zinc-binding protein [Burkholderiales bacterium]MDE2077792.1 putative zinc-binding protein [Burkholderiales bacterium]MDE2433708.1 putative zinc-binding protein [Burkholderiales bacterium]
MSRATEHLTLVYACSGCSSAAQLANHLAVRLDREGHAEMSCIAGVGGQVRPLVRKLQEAAERQRPILAIDGCHLSCVASSLALHGVQASSHIQLAAHGVRKVYHSDYCEDQAQALLSDLTLHVQQLNDQYAEQLASGALARE